MRVFTFPGFETNFMPLFLSSLWLDYYACYQKSLTLQNSMEQTCNLSATQVGTRPGRASRNWKVILNRSHTTSINHDFTQGKIIMQFFKYVLFSCINHFCYQ